MWYLWKDMEENNYLKADIIEIEMTGEEVMKLCI